jgi:hypothetical protein
MKWLLKVSVSLGNVEGLKMNLALSRLIVLYGAGGGRAGWGRGGSLLEGCWERDYCILNTCF